MDAGIYIHIPFCKSRCSYCDFATDIYRDKDSAERYINALIREILAFKPQSLEDKLIDSKFDTIYFGGGTPSLLTAKQLEKIIAAIYKKFYVRKNIEFTLEMNPMTVSIEKLRDFKSLGVNRGSFGVQTFNDRSLKLLARGHDADDARKTFEMLRTAGFENISFDLIAGLPHQTLDDWEGNLKEALKMSPEHLSLYLLEIHEGTPLAKQIQSKRQPAPDENLAGKMYDLALQKFDGGSFEQYEISNFAKSDYESKHNLKYWQCETVLGFGVSAHSFDGRQRWANECDTRKYMSLIENGEDPIVKKESMSKKKLSSEFVFLNLRLKKGLNLQEFKARFGVDLMAKFVQDLEHFKDLGLVEFDRNLLKLTKKGFAFSNEVFALFV